jgi:ribosome biogenesis protein Nip4
MKIPEELLKQGIIIRKGDDLYLFGKKPLNENFVFGGLYLGNTKTPSLHVCYELSKTNFPTATISNQAGEKFTRGENVFRKAVLRGRVTGTVIVLNKQKDCLGIGKWKNNILTNLRDVGEYLRKEKKNKSV